MKKLMIVAIAVASCTAFAEETEKSPIVLRNEADGIKQGVYTLSITQKGLEYVTKQHSKKSSAKFYGDTKAAAEEAAKSNAVEQIDGIISDFAQKGLWLDEDSFKITPKSAKKSTSKSDKKNGKYVSSGWTMTYTAQAASSKGVPTSKVVSHSVSGIYVNGYGEIDGAYIWDPKVKTSYVNKYVDKKLKPVKLATATKDDDIQPVKTIASEDGKASMVLQWETLQAVGTGTASKDEDGAYAYVKSVAGNAVDPDLFTYGTWKFAPDSKSTNIANSKDEVTKETIEEILAKKKVELAQE